MFEQNSSSKSNQLNEAEESAEGHQTLASSPARAKNGEAPGTHCFRMHLIIDNSLYYL